MAKKTNLTDKQIEEEAYKVIRGDYGNGEDRKNKLGDNYEAVQSKVNQLSKQAGGVKNVKTPSTTVSTAKNTQNNTTKNTSKSNSASSKADPSRIKTSSTANSVYSKDSTKEKRNEYRKSKGLKTVEEVPHLKTESKEVEQASAPMMESGELKELNKNKNTITLVKADGTTSTVQTKSVNNPSNVTLSSEDYDAIKKATQYIGSGDVLVRNFEDSPLTKGLAEKYGVSAKELVDAYSKQKEKEDYEYGQAHPFLSSLKSVADSVIRRPYLNAMTVVTNDVAPESQLALDYADASQNANKEVKNEREGASSNMGTAGKTAYDVGMGVADRVANTVVGTAIGSPLLGAVMNGSNTAGVYYQDAIDRGIDKQKAAVTGIINGTVDGALDVAGLETIGALKPTGKIATDLAKKFGVGAGEQAITYLVQEATDNVVNGKDSVYSVNKQNYMANGMSEKEASEQALEDEAIELAKESAMGGGFSLAMDGFNKLLGKATGKTTDANVKTNDVDTRITEPNVKSDAELDADLDRDIENLLAGLDTNYDVNSIPKSDIVGVHFVTDANGNRIPTEQIPAAKNVEITEPNVKNEIPSPSRLEEITPTDVNRTDVPNTPSDIPKVGGSGDVNYSKVTTDTLINNELSSMADAVDRRDSIYNVHHNSETMANAKNRVATDPSKWEDDYISGRTEISDDTDVDTAMLLLHSNKAKIEAETDPQIKAELQAKQYALKKKLINAGTKHGQFVQAFAKWNGTPEGAIICTERMLNENAQKWASKNKGASKSIDNVSSELTGEKPKLEQKQAQKTSGKLSKALSDMGNDSKKGYQAKIPKSHEQVVAEVRNTLDREYSGVRNQFNDNDIEVLASFVESKMSTEDITNELSHKLEHGTWFTYDESLPVDNPLDYRVKNAIEVALNGERESVNAVKPSLAETKERVRNTLDKMMNDSEFASLSQDFTDEDVDFIANLVNNGASSKELADAIKNRMTNGIWDIPDNVVNEVNNLFNEAQLYGENSKQRVDLETQAFWLLANSGNAKSSIADKFDTWRYLSMLGNPKTHMRNIIGNTMFQGVTSVSNTIAGMIEEGVDAVSQKVRNGQGIERTKAVLTPSDSNLVKACKQDAMDNAYRQLSGNKYQDVRGNISQQREVFDSNAMRKLNDINSKFLYKEDFSAMRNKYQTSMAGFLKANGADESIFNSEFRLAQLEDAKTYRLLSRDEVLEMNKLKQDVSLLNEARNYAVGQAEYSAFHEDNKVADWLSRMSSTANNSDRAVLRGIGKLFEGILPFKKTPANILKSGIEYSPLNLVNDVAKAINLKNGNGTASELIESMSKTLTGSGMVMLGAYLYDKGVLLSSEEDTKWQDSLEGKQNYSIRIGDKTYTIDFAAPSVMPLLLGAEIKKVREARNIENGTGEDGTFWDKLANILEDTTNTVSQLAQPIMETSMMSSLSDTFSELKNSENPIGTLVANMGTSYLTQGIPTLVGQIARTVDPTRRSTYTDKTGVSGVVDKKLTKIENKLPFLSKPNEEYVDAYGRTQNNSPTNNMFLNGLYQMFSPSYIADVNETPVDTELRRLYGENNKDASVFSELDTRVKDTDGGKLSKEDYTNYSATKGQLDYEIMDSLFKEDFYKSMSDEDKTALVDTVHDLAKNVSKYEVADKGLSSKEAKMYEAYKENGVQGVIDYFKSSNEYDNFAKENGLALNENGSAKTTEENVTTFANNQGVSDEEKGKILFEKWKGGNVDELSKADSVYFEGDNPDYAGFWNAHKGKAKEITEQNVNSSQIPVENTTTDVKTIPAPQSLANSNASNMIRQNAEQYEAHQEEIANFDIDKYTSSTGKKDGKRFDYKEGLPMLDEIYKTDAEKSQAIIDSGANTKGVVATREIFGDDYVYEYYTIENNADYDGNKYIKQDELKKYLSSQGYSQDEIDKWLSVFKRK